MDNPNIFCYDTTIFYHGEKCGMIFYEVELHGLPLFLHACNADYRDYKNQFPSAYTKNLIEYTLCQEGRILFSYPSGKNTIIEPGMFIPVLKDLDCKTSAYNGERQKHISIGVDVQYSFLRWDSDTRIDLISLQERVVKNGHFLIPFHYPMGAEQTTITEKMQKIIYFYFSSNPADMMNALSEWFSLTALLTTFVLKELGIIIDKHSPSTERYIRKAEKYIQNNHTEKLYIETIAQYLGISSGHLSRIFREVKGMSVVEYINQFRIEMMIRLFVRHNSSLKDLAFAVGFDDPSYASRIFKKSTGMTFRQFIAQQKECTYSSGVVER